MTTWCTLARSIKPKVGQIWYDADSDALGVIEEFTAHPDFIRVEVELGSKYLWFKSWPKDLVYVGTIN